MAPYRTPPEARLTVNDLVFVGCGGRVAALERRSGRMVWEHKVRKGFVSLLCDEGSLFVGAVGHLYCLDALTGEPRWENDLPGFGLGNVGIATARASFHQEAAIAEVEAEEAAASVP